MTDAWLGLNGIRGKESHQARIKTAEIWATNRPTNVAENSGTQTKDQNRHKLELK